MRRRYHPKHRKPRRLMRAAAAVVLAALVFLLAGLPLIEPHWYEVEETRLPMSELSEDVKRLRIVFISDIHETGGLFFSEEDTKGLVSRVNALNPDLVLLGGDYSGSSEDTAAFFSRLPAFKTNYGVFAVLGEHDRSEQGYSLEELRRVTKNKGITLLVNEAESVRIGTSSLWICGLDEPVHGQPDVNGVASRVSRDSLVILLAHNPSLIEQAQTANDRSGKRGWFDLALFGHTHGGQHPLLSGVLGLYGDVPAGHRRGWFTENRVPILVSRGIGTVGVPMRLFCRPQIHLITLVSGQ